MKKSLAVVAAIILFVVISLLMGAHYLIFLGASKRQKEAELLLASHIHDVILSKIMEPVIVSRTMANDDFLRQFINKESAEGLASDAEQMKNYLKRIKNEFSYASATFISEKTRRYYRDDGVHKIVDPSKNPHDIWYLNFLEDKTDFHIGVFRNTDNREKATMFLNVGLTDEHGKLLGVSAPSLYIDDILDLFKFYEKKFGVKINMTDETGLVVLDSNFVDISVASLTYLVSTKKNAPTGYRYMDNGPAKYAIVKYIKDLKWYFVVRGDHKSTWFLYQSFYLFALILLAAGLYSLSYTYKKIYGSKASFINQTTQEDSLTGLPNRNFFKFMFGERGVFNTTRYRTLAVFDIDFFKEANDNMDGDEVLISVVNNMLHLLDNRGMVLRWGGDEFLVLFELPIECSYAICRQFCKNVEADGLVTVSVGLTEVRISDTIKKNYYRAAQFCYLVKEMGGNGVKKG